MGQKPKGIALRQLNVIPHGRGLGSSAAAIVGGLALARALVLGGEQLMTTDEMIALGTELEGHPDNIAAAVLGSATIAWTENNVGRGVSIKVNPKIKALLFIPESHLATAKARKLLPENIPHQDAVRYWFMRLNRVRIYCWRLLKICCTKITALKRCQNQWHL